MITKLTSCCNLIEYKITEIIRQRHFKEESKYEETGEEKGGIFRYKVNTQTDTRLYIHIRKCTHSQKSSYTHSYEYNYPQSHTFTNKMLDVTTTFRL